MKTLSGAVLVLAGAVLYSGAAIESALWKRPNPVELLGFAVGALGILLVIGGLLTEGKSGPPE